MKKSNQDIKYTSEKSINENLIIDKNKTTNVNILLNRVRLDKKRNIKRKFMIAILFAVILSALTSFFIIVSIITKFYCSFFINLDNFKINLIRRFC